ncbi:transposase [Nostoc sp.]|uniref:transposase n=1 Tax=Nostoc sp. TaxID=1180 RepID=UPI0035941226
MILQERYGRSQNSQDVFLHRSCKCIAKLLLVIRPLKIVGLYGKRWDVELNLRYLKTTLGMDILRCKTLSMVRKEIYVFLLAYNLLRSLMWDAGTTYTTPPLRLSLQGTRHHKI